MQRFSFLAAAAAMCATAPVASAADLSCRVLYRISCAPDLCSPLDKVIDQVPELPKIEITISANRQSMTYVQDGKKQTVPIKVSVLSNNVRLVTGKINWPSYERAPGDSKTAPLGNVNMLFNNMNYYWRVGFTGNNASQEYDDILIGDCNAERW
jgi:hypothetical protein